MNSTRRGFLQTAIAASAFGQAPAVMRSGGAKLTDGTMAGDVTTNTATIWARSDSVARLIVDWKTSEKGASRRVRGPVTDAASDFTARVDLTGLAPGQTVIYEARFVPENGRESTSEPVRGIFRTAPGPGRNVRLVWSGDVAGQGWGINKEWGGMKGFEAMRVREPDVFLHSGDTIYADGPIVESVNHPEYGIWKNIVTEAKSKPAESVDEFRGAYRYNLMDENLRRFNAEVAQIWQWDDHEVTNNWAPGRDLQASNKLYKETDVLKLAARGRQAYLEYAPIRFAMRGPRQIHRRIPLGPLADVFVLDMRSFRGPNTYNRQEKAGPDTLFLGREQMAWLKRDLVASRAAWKILAADMPVGLLVGDGRDADGRPRWENCANGDGPALGRELEIAEILKFIKDRKILNTFWLTADVHYTAAHEYHPGRAQFSDFLPFWEFVSGPLNAGTFGPGKLDNTFGPKVVFEKAPPPGKGNLPPSAGLQFFGEVNIDAKSKVAAVTLRDIGGAALYTRELAHQT